MKSRIFLLLSNLYHIHMSANALTSPSTVRIDELLSTCVDAAQRGCTEIRKVQAKRENTGGLSKVDFKDATDPKSALTEADGAAQDAVVNALRSSWGPGLCIVGEEEEEEEIRADSGGDLSALRRDLCSENISAQEAIPLSDVTIFVDPLDGTREFVESRLSNCQTLVGIAVHGKPVAGAMGVPFPDGTLESEPVVVYGVVGAGHGVWGGKLVPSNDSYEKQGLPRPYVASGDSTAPVMMTARELALEQKGGSRVLYGGAGNKILQAALGHVDVVLQHKFGGPWDTCAPEAVLKSMGGKITTFSGDDLIVTRKDAPVNANIMGVVATGAKSAIDHDTLIDSLRKSPVIQEYLK